MKNFLLQTFFFLMYAPQQSFCFIFLQTIFSRVFFFCVNNYKLTKLFFFRKTINSAIASYLIASHAGVYRGARALLKTPAWKATYLVN